MVILNAIQLPDVDQLPLQWRRLHQMVALKRAYEVNRAGRVLSFAGVVPRMRNARMLQPMQATSAGRARACSWNLFPMLVPSWRMFDRAGCMHTCLPTPRHWPESCERAPDATLNIAGPLWLNAACTYIKAQLASAAIKSRRFWRCIVTVARNVSHLGEQLQKKHVAAIILKTRDRAGVHEQARGYIL